MSINDKNYTPLRLADRLVKPMIDSFLSVTRGVYAWSYDSIYNCKILDPAMGSGNILQAVKKNLIDREYASKREDLKASLDNHISQNMLYGIEIDKEECGKAVSNIGLNFRNVLCQDYLLELDEEYPKSFTMIIGNPPFLGGGKISGKYGDEYAKAIRKKYQCHGNADYCVYWLKKSHLLAHPIVGHMSFIMTNTISQGDTRQSGLKWMVENGWEIHNAETNITWPGDAKVTVSIVHLIRTGYKTYTADYEYEYKRDRRIL